MQQTHPPTSIAQDLADVVPGFYALPQLVEYEDGQPVTVTPAEASDAALADYLRHIAEEEAMVRAAFAALKAAYGAEQVRRLNERQVAS